MPKSTKKTKEAAPKHNAVKTVTQKSNSQDQSYPISPPTASSRETVDSEKITCLTAFSWIKELKHDTTDAYQTVPEQHGLMGMNDESLADAKVAELKLGGRGFDSGWQPYASEATLSEMDKQPCAEYRREKFPVQFTFKLVKILHSNRFLEENQQKHRTLQAVIDGTNASGARCREVQRHFKQHNPKVFATLKIDDASLSSLPVHTNVAAEQENNIDCVTVTAKSPDWRPELFSQPIRVLPTVKLALTTLLNADVESDTRSISSEDSENLLEGAFPPVDPLHRTFDLHKKTKSPLPKFSDRCFLFSEFSVVQDSIYQVAIVGRGLVSLPSAIEPGQDDASMATDFALPLANLMHHQIAGKVQDNLQINMAAIVVNFSLFLGSQISIQPPIDQRAPCFRW